jgi:hypothetical protein
MTKNIDEGDLSAWDGDQKHGAVRGRFGRQNGDSECFLALPLYRRADLARFPVRALY